MYAVNLTRTPYWSDYQTNEQYFGLLSFDPGREESMCYVDGDTASQLSAQGISIAQMLQENNAYHALEKANGLIFTGPTGTNVNDVAVLLIDTAN